MALVPKVTSIKSVHQHKHSGTPERRTMPAYQTTIMISAMTSRRRTVDLLKRAINHIIAEKGVVMGVQSLGTRALAYDIRHKKVLPAPPSRPRTPSRSLAPRHAPRLYATMLASD